MSTLLFNKYDNTPIMRKSQFTVERLTQVVGEYAKDNNVKVGIDTSQPNKITIKVDNNPYGIISKIDSNIYVPHGYKLIDGVIILPLEV